MKSFMTMHKPKKVFSLEEVFPGNLTNQKLTVGILTHLGF